MLKLPRWYRRYLKVPLFRLKKVTPPLVWVLLFLMCCLIFPFAASVKIVHPGIKATLLKGWEIAQTDLFSAAIFVFVLLVFSSMLMFVLNGAFVFMRAAMGFETRRNGTIIKWLYNKYRKSKNENS